MGVPGTQCSDVAGVVSQCTFSTQLIKRLLTASKPQELRPANSLVSHEIYSFQICMCVAPVSEMARRIVGSIFSRLFLIGYHNSSS